MVTVMSDGIQGNQVYFKRSSSTDGNLCEFRGTIAPDGRSASGTQICAGYPNMWWKATIGGAGPGPVPGSNAVRYRMENLNYNQPDVYVNPRNYHDFLVDFSNCSIREMNQESDQGRERIQVLVCRRNRRLTFTTTTDNGATVVHYDWAFRDNGVVAAGAWQQGNGFGPSVGGIYGTASEWQTR